MSSRFNNPTAMVANETPLAPFDQIKLPEFIVDLEPKQINSFYFHKQLRPYKINHKQIGLVSQPPPIKKNDFETVFYAPNPKLTDIKTVNFL